MLTSPYSLALVFLVSSVTIQLCASRRYRERRSVTYTEGAGGEKCSQGVCLTNKGVRCTSDGCDCGTGGMHHLGDGLLVCPSKGISICKAMNDPEVETFSGEVVSVPISCKFLMTAVETKVKVNGKIVGECIIQASAWGIKGHGKGRKGKEFVGGIEVEFTIMINNTIHYHAERIHGGAQNGRCKFIEQGNASPLASGAWGEAITTVVPNIGTVSTEYDVDNNIAEVKADLCGFTMGFRPQERKRDSKLIRTPQISGVYVKVNESHEPNYLASDSALCFAPKEHNNTLQNYIKKLEARHGMKVSPETAMIMRIMDNHDQEFPNAPRNLQALANTAQECTKEGLLHALENSMFITGKPKFLKCWIANAHTSYEDVRYGDEDFEDAEEIEDAAELNKALKLMAEWLQSYCGHSGMMCNSVKQTIRDSPCLKYVPKDEKNILNFNCTELNNPL